MRELTSPVTAACLLLSCCNQPVKMCHNDDDVCCCLPHLPLLLLVCRYRAIVCFTCHGCCLFVATVLLSAYPVTAVACLLLQCCCLPHLSLPLLVCRCRDFCITDALSSWFCPPPSPSSLPAAALVVRTSASCCHCCCFSCATSMAFAVC